MNFRQRRCRLVLSLVATALLGGPTRTAVGSDLKIVLPDARHPYLACSADELQRLQQAYHGDGRAHDIVAARVEDAERFVDDLMNFPPRGGQHNQWYQCDACETALRTIDVTHHECPKCKKVYSGPPYDDVIFSRQHGRNLAQMRMAAWAYAISGREEFAKYAARVLLGYAERYRTYPYHSASRETESSWGKKAGGHLYEQTLTEASALATSIGPACDLIWDSSVLTEADRAKIAQGLLLPMLENINRNKAGKSNWQTWHNAAMIWGGALVGDTAWIRKAIADDKSGFHYQMDVSVSREGMWYENSWGYHFYTLKALVDLAETARHLGIDLWSDERLQRMFTLPIDYTMANGMLPRFGDDVNSSVERVGALFEPAYHTYRDPRILALLPREPSFDNLLLGRPAGTSASLPPLESKVFEDAGHAILRMPGSARMTAAMTFGPYGGFHGHFDKLSFVFYGHGKELGVDPGRAGSQAYRLPIHSNWYKATISHNTVLVDGKSQAPAAGQLTLFEREDNYTAVGARCDAAYAGVVHDRLLLMTRTYLLVIDRLRAENDHRFDWLYHSRGTAAVSEAIAAGLQWKGDYTGAEYIQNAVWAQKDELVRIAFEDANVTTHLTMAAEHKTSIMLGDGVGSSVSDRVPMAMIGRTGRDVTYVAALEPRLTGFEPTVLDIHVEEGQGALSVVVERTVLVEPGIAEDRVELNPDTGIVVRLSR